MELPTSVDSKPLMRSLSPLDATLTKNRGVGQVWLAKNAATCLGHEEPCQDRRQGSGLTAARGC